MTQVLLIGAAAALVLSPTLRIAARWAVNRIVAIVEAKVRESFPSLAESVGTLTASDDVNDLRLVLDLAARLRDAGKPEAVKLCQQLIDQLLSVPKA